MCDSVWMWGAEWATQAQLAEALHSTIATLPLRPYADDTFRDPQACLCPTDIPAAIESIGLIPVPPFTQPGDHWEWTAIMPGHEETTDA